jgi:acetyl esterase/lipase
MSLPTWWCVIPGDEASGHRGPAALTGFPGAGGLAVALLLATRDAEQALPAAAVLMSPTVDLTSSGASMTERADQDPTPPRPCSASSPPTTWPGLTGTPEAAQATGQIGTFLRARVR